MPQPAIAGDGLIYVIAGRSVFSVNPDGTEGEEFELPAEGSMIPSLTTPLTIASDGSVFAGFGGHTSQGPESVLLNISPDFSSHVKYSLGQAGLTPVAIGPDGTAFVGDRAGKLFIIENSSPLPEKGWPSFRRDAAQTANLSGPSPVPEALENLNASSGGFAGKVRLTWNEPPVFSQFDILRADTPERGDAVVLAENLSGAMKYDDRSVEPGQTYYYWIRAKNGAGAGEYAGPLAGYAAANVQLLWTAELMGDLPSIGSDGTLYVRANRTLYAIHPATGEVKWTRQEIGSLPVITHDGLIICESDLGLIALDSEGSLKWQVEGVYLYNVDQLADLARQNLALRQSEAAASEKLIEREAALFAKRLLDPPPQPPQLLATAAGRWPEAGMGAFAPAVSI